RAAPLPRARLARFDGEPRHLPERDDASRPRDPTRPLAARVAALRRNALAARHPELRQVLATRIPTARRPPDRLGDDPAPARPRHGPGPDRRYGRPRRF